MSELQRARLVAGAVAVFDELGYERATVARITARAGVSRRTFYDLFADREECLAAVLEEAAALVEADLAAAGLGGLSWRERVREGVWRILVFLDREPALARVCVVEALRADQGGLGRRGELLARLAAVVDEGRLEGARGANCSSLTAEGLVGAAFAIVHARLARGESGPLVDLTGELVGMIVLPYLGPAAARREQARAVSAVAPGVPTGPSRPVGDLLKDMPPLRLTYRTARVLEAVAELSDRGTEPSNRMVAERAGVSDAGQISRLLRRLERLGLLANTWAGHPKGEPNAWALTATGERVACGVRERTGIERRAA